ncbi:MAG: hypothetical protein AAF401_14800 [Pseudomonadota bacterium]
MHKRRGTVEIVARAESRAAAPEDIVAELKDKLRAETRVPKIALLATDRAVLHLADLPVDPARPRPYAQMRELARWEAEPLFPDLPNWSVRDVLLRSARVTQTQDAEIVEEAEAQGGLHVARYQDVALSMKLLPRSTRDAALDQQERLSAPVAEAACGWTPARAGDSVDGAQHPWLISALSSEQRTAWLDAFKSAKLSLEEIVPGWGLSLSTLTLRASALVLERRPGALFIARAGERGVESARLIDLNRAGSREDDAINRVLEGREADAVHAIGFDDDAAAQILAINEDAQFEDGWPAAALKGLAARKLIKNSGVAAPIRLKEPRSPIYKNPDLARVALVLFVLLGAAGVHFFNDFRLQGLKSRLADLDQEYADGRTLKQKVDSMISEVDQLKVEIETAEADLAVAADQAAVAAYIQDRRPALIEGLLTALILSANPEVVLRMIEEDDKRREVFMLSAWALDDVAAETYNTDLNRNLASINLSVADESVTRGKGPQGIDGVNLVLRIAPVSDPQVMAAETLETDQ